MEALTELCLEETRLCGSGPMPLPLLLVARPHVAPMSLSAPSSSPRTTLSPSAASSGGSGRPRYAYYSKEGHVETNCYQKKHLWCSSGASTLATSSATSSTDTQREIVTLLRRLVATSGSALTDSATLFCH